MKNAWIEKLQSLYHVTRVPLSLLDGDGNLIVSFPEIPYEAVNLFATAIVLDDFRAQGRDAAHPLVSFIEPGFFLGVMELDADCFLLLGLVSPIRRARNEVLSMVTTVGRPEHLQSTCDLILQVPLMTLEQVKDQMCLIADLLLETRVKKEDILFMDVYTSMVRDPSCLEERLFEQRESAEPHLSMDFEMSLCEAVEHGNRAQLEQRLNTPVSGRVGRMSSDALRQEKYIFIALATVTARAAIRGGLSEETVLNLSDLYCQRMDSLSEPALIKDLSIRMLLDYCDRVGELRHKPAASGLIRQCLAYISVHLHEDITLEQLSGVCGLCTRSLSLRFRDEMGISIRDYLNRERINEAKYLLRHTGYPLSQIAAYLNYSSQSYFTRLFQKQCGMTPSQYRESIG